MSTTPARSGLEQDPFPARKPAPDRDPAPVADRGEHGADGTAGPGTAADGAAATGDGGTEEQPPAVVHPGEPGFPPPPEGIVEAAKLAPGHWLNVVDQHWEGEQGEEPPSWAMLGRWRTDGRGEIVEWERNDEYRPSPERMGWPEPAGPADRAMQLAATGYGPEEAVAGALAGAEVAVCVDDEGRPSVTETPEGVPAVAVFSTAPGMDTDQFPPYVVMPVPDLLEQLGEQEQVLFLSSSAPVALLIDRSELHMAAREGRADAPAGPSNGSGAYDGAREEAP